MSISELLADAIHEPKDGNRAILPSCVCSTSDVEHTNDNLFPKRHIKDSIHEPSPDVDNWGQLSVYVYKGQAHLKQFVLLDSLKPRFFLSYALLTTFDIVSRGTLFINVINGFI